jgi:hypothetical protein
MPLTATRLGAKPLRCRDSNAALADWRHWRPPPSRGEAPTAPSNGDLTRTKELQEKLERVRKALDGLT